MNKSEIGKKSRAAGQRFEVRVRDDLEKKGWIVDKWTNNVELFEPKFLETRQMFYAGELPSGKLIKAKAKWAGSGRPMMMGAGFPDFIAYRNIVDENLGNLCGIMEAQYPLPEDTKIRISAIIGVEAKSNGTLDKIEKEKCAWLLENEIFGKIMIASKDPNKRGKINYIEYKNA